MIARDPRTSCLNSHLLALVILAGAWAASAEATDRDAAIQVREGVRLHEAGEFEQAAAAFSKAAESLPADRRIAFNQGCALAAQGKHEEAETLLRDAALARDVQVAAAAYYNLGCLAADQMKALFGDQPEEAVDPTREEGLLLVRTAVDHYRQALRANPEHAAARRNLELLRIWSKHIQDRWAERDRQRRRDAMELLEFLAWLQDQQREVRRRSKALPNTLDTPRLRQTVRQLSAAQRELTLEIEPLKGKLDQALQPPPAAASPGGPPAPPPAAPQPLSPELQQVRDGLHGLADEAGNSMTQAADVLTQRRVADAITSQSDVLPPLNQLFEFLAPFEAILQTAITTETRLVATSKAASATGSASTAVVAAAEDHEPPASANPDFQEAAESQRFVSGWAGMLTRKAQQLLAEADQAAASESGQEPAAATDRPTEIPLPARESTDEPPSDANADPPAAAAESPAAPPAPDAATAPPADPRAAYEKAVELGPRIKTLTSEAAVELNRQAWSAALPKQEEALKLLKEIAALLPPQENQENDQEQDQDNQDQENQDQENQDDQEKSDQESPDQPSDEDQKKQQDDPQDDSKSQDDGEKKQSDEEQKSQQEAEEDLSRQQAESLLRQVRAREREHRELEKEIRRLLRSRIMVEKDW